MPASHWWFPVQECYYLLATVVGSLCEKQMSCVNSYGNSPLHGLIIDTIPHGTDSIYCLIRESTIGMPTLLFFQALLFYSQILFPLFSSPIILSLFPQNPLTTSHSFFYIIAELEMQRLALKKNDHFLPKGDAYSSDKSFMQRKPLSKLQLTIHAVDRTVKSTCRYHVTYIFAYYSFLKKLTYYSKRNS